MTPCLGVGVGLGAVFFRSKKQTHRTTILFGLMGLNAAELHGNLTQLQRLEALEAFRDGQVRSTSSLAGSYCISHATPAAAFTAVRNCLLALVRWSC